MPTTILESTAIGMNKWWKRSFVDNVQLGRKRVWTAATLRYITRADGPIVVTWIDDRNEAARLGVSVEELLEARRVTAALDVSAAPVTERQILHASQLVVPAPRLHGQLTGIV